MASSTTPPDVIPVTRKHVCLNSSQHKCRLTAYRFYETPTITLFVGTSQKAFYVHVDLLCDASSFFKAALTGDFKESSDKTMQFPEDDENTFSLFIDWLYHQRQEMLALPPDDQEDSDDEDNEVDNVEKKENGRYTAAFKLFVFAERYHVPDLKRLLTKMLFADGATRRAGPFNTSIDYLYAHTAQSTGIRRLVADWHAWRMDPVYFQRRNFRAFLERHPEFSADINLSYAKNLRRGSNYNPFGGAMPDEYMDE